MERKGSTLTELLVVVGVLSVVGGMLLPAQRTRREESGLQSRQGNCQMTPGTTITEWQILTRPPAAGFHMTGDRRVAGSRFGPDLASLKICSVGAFR